MRAYSICIIFLFFGLLFLNNYWQYRRNEKTTLKQQEQQEEIEIHKIREENNIIDEIDTFLEGSSLEMTMEINGFYRIKHGRRYYETSIYNDDWRYSKKARKLRHELYYQDNLIMACEKGITVFKDKEVS